MSKAWQTVILITSILFVIWLGSWSYYNGSEWQRTAAYFTCSFTILIDFIWILAKATKD